MVQSPPAPQERPVAAITGASSGIGAATARHLAAAGFEVVLGARRPDRLAEVAAEVGDRARTHPLDVTDAAAVTAFARSIERCDVLVCNAGGALGFDRVEQADEASWRWMWETNVWGVVASIRAMLPALRASEVGRVVVVTSLAAHEVYPGGAGYASAKHAAAAITDTLRLELADEAVQVIEVAPGMTRTEFSVVRSGGDEEANERTYRGLTPLSPDDIAEAITWAVTRPLHVSIPRLDIYPAAQAAATVIKRTEEETAS